MSVILTGMSMSENCENTEYPMMIVYESSNNIVDWRSNDADCD